MISSGQSPHLLLGLTSGVPSRVIRDISIGLGLPTVLAGGGVAGGGGFLLYMMTHNVLYCSVSYCSLLYSI